MAIRYEQALRNIERIRIILDRSPAQTTDLKDGHVQFDGFRINMIDAFKVQELLEQVDQYLRRGNDSD